jgi:predicted Zn-dependent protease
MEALERDVERMSRALLRMDGRSAVANKALGYLALRLAQVREARPYYEAAYAVRPADPEVFRPLFGMWVAAGEEAKAIAELTSLVARHPRDEAIYQTLYKHYMEKRDFAAARGVLEGKLRTLGETSARAIELAAHEETSGNVPGARQLLAELEAKQPGTAEYRIRLARYHARFGRLAEAAAELEKGLAAFPAAKVTLLREKAQLLLRENRAGEAADLLGAAAREFPNDLGLRYDEARIRGVLSSDPAQASRAEAIYRSFQTASDAPRGWQVDYARYLLARNRSQEAASALEQVSGAGVDTGEVFQLRARLALSAGSPFKAQVFAQKAFEKDGASPEAATLLAECLAANGNHREAADFLVQWTGYNRRVREVQIQTAGLYAESDRAAMAKRILTEIESAPDLSAAELRSLAGVYQRLGDSAKAIAVVDRGLRERAGSFALLEAKARILEGMGRGAEAAAIAAQLAKSNSEAGFQAELRLASLAMAQRDWNTAGEHLSKAESAAGQQPAVMAARAGWHEAQDRWAAAQAVYEKMLQAEARSALAANGLAWTLAMQGRYSDAKRYSTMAVRESPKDVNFQDTAAWIELKTGGKAAALNTFQQLIVLDRANAGFHFHYVEALLANQMAEAPRELIKAKAKGPVPFECRNLEARVSALAR